MRKRAVLAFLGLFWFVIRFFYPSMITGLDRRLIEVFDFTAGLFLTVFPMGLSAVFIQIWDWLTD